MPDLIAPSCRKLREELHLRENSRFLYLEDIAPAHVGDACQAIHPIAGQGFNLGLRDALILAKTFEKSRELGLEPFNLNLMKSYENMRKLDKTLLVNATHNLNGLFSGSGKFKSLFRKTGLRIFSQSNFLKNQSMLFAMGLRNLEA